MPMIFQFFSDSFKSQSSLFPLSPHPSRADEGSGTLRKEGGKPSQNLSALLRRSDTCLNPSVFHTHSSSQLASKSPAYHILFCYGLLCVCLALEQFSEDIETLTWT